MNTPEYATCHECDGEGDFIVVFADGPQAQDCEECGGVGSYPVRPTPEDGT